MTLEFEGVDPTAMDYYTNLRGEGPPSESTDSNDRHHFGLRISRLSLGVVIISLPLSTKLACVAVAVRNPASNK